MVLTADEGTRLAGGTARALGEWTTDALIPFQASLSLEGTGELGNALPRGPAILILSKANPSDRPGMEQSVNIRVFITLGP